MFVSVIFNTEYMDVSERIKWFLKNLSHARENDWLIITHEYLGQHFHELVESCDERFYDEFEMQHINPDDLASLDIYYVPDKVFDQIYDENGSRTRMLLALENERNLELERHVEKAIQKGLSRRGETRVEGIFNMLHCFKSLRHIARKYQCPLIPYTFTAIRKVHGYCQTLYMANTDGFLFDSQEAEKRYQQFIQEMPDFPWLTNKEILALLGKERNLPLLGLMDANPVYEVGVAVEAFSITPQCYLQNTVTDDDIYYACKKRYPQNKVISRVHPIKYDTFGIGRQNLRNDPISFLLSCKRIATVQSQLIVKAALWKRVACVSSKALPFAFLCEKDYTSETYMDVRELNFLIFCYFIPSGCMFDQNYWRWRISCPSEKDIFFHHINYLLSNMKLSTDFLYLHGEKARIKTILEARECSPFQINQALYDYDNEEVDYNYLLSKLEVYYEPGSKNPQPVVKTMFCRNLVEKKCILSHFSVEEVGRIEYLKFYPFDDIGGVASLQEIICNGEKIEIEDFIWEEKKYLSKSSGAFPLLLNKTITKSMEITFKWNAFSVEEYLLSK